MAVLNTCSAAVLWNGAKIGKVTNLTFNVQRSSLDQTAVGECSGSYSSGRRDTTASGRILYDPSNPATVLLMNRIFDQNPEPSDRLTIVSKTGESQGTIEGNVIITSMSVPYAVGELLGADISFQFSGTLVGSF